MATRLSRVTVQAPSDPRLLPRPAQDDAAAIFAPMFALTRTMLDISREWLDLQRSLLRQQQDLALAAAQTLLPVLEAADRPFGFELRLADGGLDATTRLLGLWLDAGTAALRQPAPTRP